MYAENMSSNHSAIARIAVTVMVAMRMLFCKTAAAACMADSYL
jgi:hypothetical protein